MHTTRNVNGSHLYDRILYHENNIVVVLSLFSLQGLGMVLHPLTFTTSAGVHTQQEKSKTGAATQESLPVCGRDREKGNKLIFLSMTRTNI